MPQSTRTWLDMMDAAKEMAEKEEDDDHPVAGGYSFESVYFLDEMRMLRSSLAAIPPHLHMMRHTYRYYLNITCSILVNNVTISGRSTKFWQQKSFYDTSLALQVGQHCTALYCILYCTSLYCTVLQVGQHIIRECVVRCRNYRVSTRSPVYIMIRVVFTLFILLSVLGKPVTTGEGAQTLCQRKIAMR